MAKSKDQAIGEAIAVLVSQGRDVTTAAILSRLHAAGFPKVKPGEIYQSAAWNELRAKEKTEVKPQQPASEAAAIHQTAKKKQTEKAPPKTEKPMAKKPSFPSRPCPKCGKPIHARLQKHEMCGWVMADAAAPPRPKAKKPGARSGDGISLEDIEAVKAVVDKLGAEKVQQLAKVLGR